MNINIYPVIVVYNKRIEESLTLRSLITCNIINNHIHVIDNSTKEYDVESSCKSKGYQYYSMNGNKGLSKAYNAALSLILPKTSSDDLIIWLDDDTAITPDYFSLLESCALQHEEIDIFAPIIKGQDDIIYSPNRYGFFRSSYLKTPEDEIDYSEFNGINSCLAIRARIFKNYRYSEDLFMDLTDNLFFDDMRNMNKRFFILRTVIYQTFFQRGNNISAVKILKRLKIKIIDFMVYARKKGFGYLCLGLLKTYAWGISLSLKTKSITVLIKCITWGNKEFIKNLIRK